MTNSLSTGILGLDLALGSGGIPRGRLVEIYGPEKCGKTALCLSILAQVQKWNGAAAFIDTDQTLDASRAARMGIDVQKVIYTRPENTLQALDISRTLTRSGAVDLIVLDSVVGLLTLGVQSPTHSASSSTSQLFSQAVRELSVIAGETGTTLIFTNELRERAGVVYGVPVTTPGGIALKLHAAVRLEMLPREVIRSGSSQIGEQIQVRVIKPKSTDLFSTIIINIMYNGIVSRLDNLFDLAVELEVINKQGGFYSFGPYSLGRGRQAAIASLSEQPQLAEKIETAVRGKFLPPSTALAGEERS